MNGSTRSPVPFPEMEGRRAESLQKASRMGGFQPLHTEMPAGRGCGGQVSPLPLTPGGLTRRDFVPAAERPLTCLLFAGCTRLCPQLSAQSSVQISSAWGSSGGCAPEGAMGTVLERKAPHPLGQAADQLPRGLKGLLLYQLKTLYPQAPLKLFLEI